MSRIGSKSLTKENYALFKLCLLPTTERRNHDSISRQENFEIAL